MRYLYAISWNGPTAQGAANELLLRHPLFEGVRPERIQALLAHAVIRKVASGSLLHTPGQPNSPMYLLLTGRLRAFQLTAQGRKLILEIIQPGGFDGLLPMLGQRGHFTEAADDSLVACLEWDLLEQLLASEPRIIRTLTELLARRLESREEQLESMVIRNPTRRLARQLSALARAVGDTDTRNGSVDLPRAITHQLLADMLGVRRETVTLHLHDLIEMGAVETRRRQLSVRPRQLDAIASHEE